MYGQKNEILLLNSNLMRVEEVLDAFITNIKGSNLSPMEKEKEINLARQVFRDGYMQMDTLRNAVADTKFYKAYAYVAGYTDIPIQETPMQVNGFTSFLGNIAPKVTGFVGNILGKPELGQHFGGQVQNILGTNTSCGVLGGLFNTKKCREKVQSGGQTNPLIKPAIFSENPVLSQPAQQTLSTQIKPVEDVVIKKDVIASRDKGDDKKPFLEEYGIWIAGALLAYFLFFKKGKKIF